MVQTTVFADAQHPSSRKHRLPSCCIAALVFVVIMLSVQLGWFPDMYERIIKMGASAVHIQEVCVEKFGVLTIFTFKNIFYMWRYPNSYVMIKSRIDVSKTTLGAIGDA